MRVCVCVCVCVHVCVYIMLIQLFSLEKGCVLPTGKDQTSQSVIYRVGTTIIFSCREGYELFGVSHQVCQEEEMWSNTHPRCERKLTIAFL